MIKLLMAIAASLAVSGCAVVPEVAGPQDQFYLRLMSLCGHSFAGRVVSADAQDGEIAASPLVMHVRTCSAGEVRIPFHVGDNRSRTWVVSRRQGRLHIAHVHRHEDGSEDAVSQYGGATVAPGNPRRQEFPADEFSRTLFAAQNIPESATNVWAIEIVPGEMFAYELRRAGRHFRVEFDLARPVTPPPPPWGER